MVEKIASMNNFLINIFKLIYINILWLVATLLGFIIFSIGPATYAATVLIHRQLYINDSFQITKTFVFHFKEKYRESLIISWFYFLLGHVLVIDLLYMSNLFLKILIIFISFFYVLSLTYIFPIMVHYQIKGILKKIKLSFLVGFGSLQFSLLLYAYFAVIGWLIVKFVPGIIPIFGISLILFPIIWVSRQIFSRVEDSENFNKKELIKKGV